MTQVPHADDADIEIGAPGMCPINLLPSRRRQALDTVVAGPQEDGAQYVDEDVKPDVQILGRIARALKEDATPQAIFIEIGLRCGKNGNPEIDEKRDQAGDGADDQTEPVAGGELPSRRHPGH